MNVRGVNSRLVNKGAELLLPYLHRVGDSFHVHSAQKKL